MNIAFFSLDSNLQKWVQSLGDRVHLVGEMKHLNGVVQDILDKDSYREMILFLDFDWELKKVEAFNKQMSKKEDGVIRIAISSEMSIKDLKKHQQGKTSCHGYLRKPLTYVILRKLLEDFGVYEQYKECFDFELPEKEEVKEKAAPKVVSKEEVIEDLSNELFGLGEETAMSSASEISDIPELRDPEATQTDSAEVDISLDEDDQDDFTLDALEAVEDNKDDDDTDFNLSEDEDFNLEADDDEGEDDHFDLDLTDGGSDFSAHEIKVDTVVKNLVDLHSVSGPDTPYEGSLNDRIQAKFDHVFPREEVAQERVSEPVHQHFMDEDDLNIAPITVHLDEDLESELDELTQNRKLPSPEELSEFQENTGDIDISELDHNIDIDFSEGDDMDLQEMSLNADAQAEEQNKDEEFDLQVDSVDHEDIDMNDENDSLDFEDELDLGEDSPEGELSFSDAEDSEELDLSEDAPTNEGPGDEGLDFDLSMDLDDGIGELETSVQSEDISESEDNGMELGDLDSDDAQELDFSDSDDSGDESAAMEASGEESIDEELDFSVSDSSDEDALEFGAGVEESENTDKEPVTSSFDEGELSFGGDEDEDIDATTVFNANSLSNEEVESAAAPEEALGASDVSDSDEELDFSVDLDDEDMAEDLFSTEASDEDDLESMDFDDDETNPTMLMSQDMTNEVEDMIDEEISTQEFRPETPTAPSLSEDDEDTQEEDDVNGDDDLFNEFSDDSSSFNADSAIEGSNNDSDLEGLFEQEATSLDPDESSVAVGFGAAEHTSSMVSDEILDRAASDSDTEESETDDLIPSQEGSQGHLSITSESERIPPSFHEGEAVRLQATIRQLREERATLLDEINLLKQDKKLMEQDNLGLRAELDEAKIEISILKKRHTSEVDEMKYKLRISDEKKLYAEEKAKNLQKEFDRLQHKVRMDFNQIKAREKELEGQLELAKMDSESQVTTRDKKILDLKRKIDQLEFNMENAVIKEEKSREDKQKLEDRLERIMKTLRGSIEVLEDDMEWQAGKKDGR